jgi:5'-deoxy-5'-methylthioadenosine phosphorylase
MVEIAIIGGTGFSSLKTLEITKREMEQTPYGSPSSPLVYGNIYGKEVVFLARHGSGHTIPPHSINYRANIWALKNIGIKQVIAIASVGGLEEKTAPGEIVIPDQIIDYTYSRKSTFFDKDLEEVVHVDFSHPYDADLRNKLITAGNEADIGLVDSGVYGATQGPRLETAAEIQRMRRDGCTLVGMTGMPEAALARELELDYASLAVVANWAAGIHGEVIEMSEIEKHLMTGMEKVKKLLEKLMKQV